MAHEHDDNDINNRLNNDDDSNNGDDGEQQNKGVLTNLFAELCAEFVGTFVLILIGCGSNAQGVLSHGRMNNSVQGPITGAVGMFFGQLCSTNISGGHLNPSVTIALAWHEKFHWGKVVFYITAQVAGAFAAALVVFLNYAKALEKYSDNGDLAVPPQAHATAQIFGTYPVEQARPGVNATGKYPDAIQCFFDQFLSTAFFLFVIGLVSDQRGPFAGQSTQYAPYLISIAIYVISASMAFNCMNAINPARDFGPRLMTFFVGYGWDVITNFNNFFWVPIVGPILGAMFGFGFYLQTIGAHNAEKLYYKEHPEILGNDAQDEGSEQNNNEDENQSDDHELQDINKK